MMIQRNPMSGVSVDSGAARSVCPKAFGKQLGCVETPGSRAKSGFGTATGRKAFNQGARTITGTTNCGMETSMTYVVADVTVPLDSVSHMADKGATIVFHRTGGYISKRGQA